MSFLGFLSNFAETKEKHNNPNLRTRYYSTEYKAIRNIINDYAKENEYLVTKIDDKKHEIFLQNTKFHIIISIIQITPMETAVDIKVQTYNIIGMNKPVRSILDLYSYLNNKLKFKGVSLHP